MKKVNEIKLSDKDKNVGGMSEIKTSDIIHLYPSIRYRYKDNSGIWNETTLLLYGASREVWGEDDSVIDFEEIDSKIMLVLKHVSNLSSNERKEYYSLCKKILNNDKSVLFTVDTPESLLFIFKNHYDAFDLIERGLALDASII